MLYDKRFIHSKLRKWENFLMNYDLPSWDELPKLELYMDQVLVLLTEYLHFLPREEANEKLITPSIINNYVRMKIIPPPVKKKYSRVHLAYLIMICTLKQSLNISYIQKMIPSDSDEVSIKITYDQFVYEHKRIANFFCDQVRAAGTAVMDDSNKDESAVNTLVLDSAFAANFAKLLTEKVLNLQNTVCDTDSQNDAE